MSLEYAEQPLYLVLLEILLPPDQDMSDMFMWTRLTLQLRHLTSWFQIPAVLYDLNITIVAALTTLPPAQQTRCTTTMHPLICAMPTAIVHQCSPPVQSSYWVVMYTQLQWNKAPFCPNQRTLSFDLLFGGAPGATWGSSHKYSCRFVFYAQLQFI